MRNEMQNRIERYNLTNRVTFHGSVDLEDVYSYFKSATLLVHPTIFEGFGIVLLEAMVCGLPVVTSDISAVKDSTGGNAILLPPKNIKLWVESIRQLLDDESLRNEFSRRGMEWAKQFTWEKKAEEYEMCLKEAVEKFNRRS
jgi:glycosyltransferase involved in cell wall biosynthesis